MARKFSVRRLAIRFGFLALLAMAAKMFALCPDSPNCVSTLAALSEHSMKPIPWTESSEDAIDLIKRAVDGSFSRTKLAVEKPEYLRYEFTSLLFRFVDDIEFVIDQETKLIHFRSASRVGHSDLGANRRRMDRFLEAFERLR